jgi:hypothetical protein
MSTREESFLLLPELRRRQVRSLILVTSDFHTARASLIFRAAERAARLPPARCAWCPRRTAIFTPAPGGGTAKAARPRWANGKRPVANALGM